MTHTIECAGCDASPAALDEHVNALGLSTFDRIIMTRLGSGRVR